MENNELKIGKSYLSPNGRGYLTILNIDKTINNVLIEQSEIVDGVAIRTNRNDEFNIEQLEHYLHQWTETTEKIKYKIQVQRMQINIITVEIEGNCKFDATQIAEKNKATYVYGQTETDVHYSIVYK